MKTVFSHLAKYKKESLVAPLFKLLEAAFELLVPLVVARLIDTGIVGADKAYIIKMCLVLVLLAGVGLVCSVTAQYFAARAATGCTSLLRQTLFQKLQSLDYSVADGLGTSAMITRMTGDMNQVQTGVNLTLRLLLRSPFVVFGAAIMAFTIDTKAAVVFAVVIPLLCIVVFSVMLRCIPLYKRVQSALDGVLLTIRENLTGVRVLRAFNKQKQQCEAFTRKNDVLTSLQLFTGRISAIMNPVTLVIINAAAAMLIYTGAVRVNSGAIKQGEVVALYNYMSQILVELVKLANLIISITKAAASANRIEAVLLLGGETGGNITEIPKATTAIEFKNVSFTYKNAAAESLHSISFKVNHGQTVGIIGATGSGKTTLINLIPHFYTADSGTVKLNGINVNDIDLTVLRSKIAVVPQNPMLFSGTIRENLLWGNPSASDFDLLQSLHFAQADDIIQKKENGLDEMLEQGGKNLSGGQQQRLTIARALVKKPEILILDDSASALDFATEAALKKSLSSLPFNPTVFIVSQRTSSVMNADIILVLENGACVSSGTHSSLLEESEIYREIYHTQFGGVL